MHSSFSIYITVNLWCSDVIGKYPSTVTTCPLIHIELGVVTVKVSVSSYDQISFSLKELPRCVAADQDPTKKALQVTVTRASGQPVDRN